MKHHCHKCGERRECVYFMGGPCCRECRQAIVDAYPPLPETVKKTRREVVVTWEGKTYRFASRTAARREMRTILRRKRLPSEVAQQIG